MCCTIKFMIKVLNARLAAPAALGYTFRAAPPSSL